MPELLNLGSLRCSEGHLNPWDFRAFHCYWTGMWAKEIPLLKEFFCQWVQALPSFIAIDEVLVKQHVQCWEPSFLRADFVAQGSTRMEALEVMPLVFTRFLVFHTWAGEQQKESWVVCAHMCQKRVSLALCAVSSDFSRVCHRRALQHLEDLQRASIECSVFHQVQSST